MSPKGRLRMIGMAVIALTGVLALYLMAPTWLVFLPVMIARGGIGLVALYWVSRRWFVHTRTHELDPSVRHLRDNALIVAVAVIIGFSLVGA